MSSPLLSQLRDSSGNRARFMVDKPRREGTFKDLFEDMGKGKGRLIPKSRWRLWAERENGNWLG